MTSLAANLEATARRYPDRPAVRLDDEVLTYADLWEQSGRVGGWLRHHGIRPGERVGLMLPNVTAFPVLYYGILRAGGVVVPMNPLLKSREVKHYLGDSGARLVFAAPMSESGAPAGARGAGAESVTVAEELLGEIAGQPPSEEVAERADEHT